MAYEFLKKLFKTDDKGNVVPMTYEELEAAIDADKDIKVINLSEGGFVSKAKYDAKDEEVKGIRQQLTDANAEIQSYKDMDIEGIKTKAAEWENKYTTETQALNNRLAEQAREHAEDMFMAGYKFTSKAARNGVLSELRAKKFQLDNGTLLGGKEFMDSLMANEEYKGAFVTEEKPEVKKPEETVQKPRFAGPTGGSTGGAGGDNKPLIDFGFNRIRQPKGN